MSLEVDGIPYFDEKNNIIDIDNNEIQEQLDAEHYIEADDVVLEVGARYGTVSNIINRKLATKTNQVSVDPDTNIIRALKKNRDNHDAGYHIFNGYISNKVMKKVEGGYGTHLVKVDTNDNNTLNNNISYQDLKKKYNLNFNVLVADCEGCLENLLEDIGSDIQNYNKILMEKDFPKLCNYDKIDSYLKSKGFECVRDGFHSVYLKPKVTESFQVLGINYYLYWFLIVILFIVFILMIKKW
jgi:FkbM family methyltransferase